MVTDFLLNVLWLQLIDAAVITVIRLMDYVVMVLVLDNPHEETAALSKALYF